MEIIETENGLEIQLKRGNTGHLTVTYDIDGVVTPFVTGDKVTFTVRKSLEGSVVFDHIVTSFVEGAAVCDATVADTEALIVAEKTGYNDYVFDIKVELATGDVSTIGPGVFKLVGVATHE